jgi:hypothetical protein
MTPGSPSLLASKAPVLFASLTFLAIGYYSLTPLVGVDCWWHMRFAEYFLQNHTPVLYDPFAIQGEEKILATYPDLFPGTLFLVVFKNFSYLGLNILRISVYLVFVASLLLATRKSWSGYAVLIQISILAMAMAGRELLQPDLFNYVLFVAWIYLLEEITTAPRNQTFLICVLIFIEQLWVNTHPIFFYHGLFIGSIYFIWAIMTKWRATHDNTDIKSSIRALCIYLMLLQITWLANPLGWRALQSLFVNMLDPEFTTQSTMTFLQSLHIINTYLYMLVCAMFLLLFPGMKRQIKSRFRLYAILLVVILVPALVYERCWPYVCIMLILIQSRYVLSWHLFRHGITYTFMVLSVCISLAIAFDRDFHFTRQLSNSVGLQMYGSSIRGTGIEYVYFLESVREVNIINQIAGSGNCLTNRLEIASCAVWHCKDKPFMMYGHAAVINARYKELKAFLANMAGEEAKHIVYKYDIRTVIVTDAAEDLLSSALPLIDYLQLIYIDPCMAIFARKDSISQEQQEKIREFYASFRPGIMDAQRFTARERVVQFFLLWFSAEMTGNSGDWYLEVAKQFTPPENLARMKEKLSQLLPGRTQN